jgi:hypothetical protein
LSPFIAAAAAAGSGKVADFSGFTLHSGESHAVVAGEGKTPRRSNKLAIPLGPFLAEAQFSHAPVSKRVGNEHFQTDTKISSPIAKIDSNPAGTSTITIYVVNLFGTCHVTHSSTANVETMSLKSLIHRSSNDIGVLTEAIAALSSFQQEPLPDKEARAHRRYTIDGSAMLCYEHDKIWIPIYVRDISERGIGFHHGTALREGIAAISLKIAGHPITQLWAKIRWCSKVDDGMFLSGSEVMGVAYDIPSPW